MIRHCWPALLLCTVVSVYSYAAWAQQRVLVKYSSGTAFFISDDGYLLTNNHVVHHCSKITVHGAVSKRPAVVVARDPKHDLALLKSHVKSVRYARLNSMKQPLREGDPVVITGYPGASWKTGEPVTRKGKIIDIKALRQDGRWLAFTDAVSQGNSGGPLLDASANVVGVVSARGRSYDYNLATQAKNNVQKIGLAVSLPMIRRFLKENSQRYRQGDSGLLMSTNRVAGKAKQFIVNVQCRHDQTAVPQPRSREIRLRYTK